MAAVTASPAATLSPLIVNVRLTAGDYIPMGAGITGALNHGNATDSNRDKQTLTIEIFNRTGQSFSGVEVRYWLYKIVTITETRPARVNGVYQFRKLTRELPPERLSSGVETIALRAGERRYVSVHASLLNEDGQSRPIYNRRGFVIGYDVTRREDIYGYIITVLRDGQVLAEQLSPCSIRNDVKPQK